MSPKSYAVLECGGCGRRFQCPAVQPRGTIQFNWGNDDVRALPPVTIICSTDILPVPGVWVKC